MAKHLTEKQHRFCIAYLETANGCEAYRRSYNAGRMSQPAIEVEALRLLQNPLVASKVAELRAAAVEMASALTSTPAGEPTQEPSSDQAKVAEDPVPSPDPMPVDPVPNPNPMPCPMPISRLEREQRAIFDRGWVLASLKRNAEIAMGDRPVKIKVKAKDSDEVTEIEVTQRNGAVANKALELLGRVPEIGLFTEQPSADQVTGKPMTSTEEWLAKVRAEAVTLRPVRVAPPVIEHQPVEPPKLGPHEPGPKLDRAYNWLPSHNTRDEPEGQAS